MLFANADGEMEFLKWGPWKMRIVGITYYNHGYGYGNPVVDD